MFFQNRRGLTLIEIIVMITAIGVLAVMLLPLFARNHESSRHLSCASNLNQLGKAMFMYADVPSNAVFPTTSTDSNDPFACNSPMAAWGLLYNKYVADPRVFSCRGNPTNPKELQDWVPGQPVPASCNYAYDPGHSPSNAVVAIAGIRKARMRTQTTTARMADRMYCLGPELLSTETAPSTNSAHWTAKSFRTTTSTA
jgi:type II secretory pathway pseudopilin PulG